MILLLVCGKYQYGKSELGVSTEYAAFMPAFRNLGFEVEHFETWQRSRHSSFAELNAALVDKVRLLKPEILFFIPLHFEIWVETFDTIRALGVTTICWTTDDSWKYNVVSKYIGSHFDLVTTTYEHIIPLYFRDGIPQVLLTQWAANSDALNPPLPAADCSYLVTFVGAAHGNRIERVNKLLQLGVKVKCFGYGWDNGSIDAEEIPNIMRDSVISLNFANSRGENQIKARTFEVPGAGGFLVTDSAQGLENFFDFDEEIIVVQSDEELAERVQYFLLHLDERDRIARAGFERTKRDHTYEARLSAVIGTASQSKKISSSLNESDILSSWDAAFKKHTFTPMMKLFRSCLIGVCKLVWGNMRGSRAARRIVFELSRRFLGSQTFGSAGLPGRMFYEES